LTTKLYVGNLSYEVSQADLQTMFAAHGTVVSAQLIMDRETRRSKGFGFVEMASEQDAKAAIAELHGKNVDGRPLTVNEARPQEPRAAGRGGMGANSRGPGGNGGSGTIRGPYGLGRGGGNRH